MENKNIKKKKEGGLRRELLRDWKTAGRGEAGSEPSLRGRKPQAYLCYLFAARAWAPCQLLAEKAGDRGGEIREDNKAQEKKINKCFLKW